MVARITVHRTTGVAHRLPDSSDRSEQRIATAAEESMGKRDGQQKGPQEHAEGQHGERAHSRFIEQIHQPMDRGADDATDREQNDDADESGGFDRQRR